MNKTSTGAVSGTFAGRPQGAVWQEDGYTLILNYTGGTGNDVTVTLATPVEAWRFQTFGTIANTGLNADSADKDADGTSNLLEYALAMTPNIADSIPLSVEESDGTLSLTYTLNKAATDLTYTGEWSDNLTTWSASSVTQTLVPGSDNGVTQQIKISVPSSPSGRRFLRLKVSRP